MMEGPRVKSRLSTQCTGHQKNRPDGCRKHASDVFPVHNHQLTSLKLFELYAEKEHSVCRYSNVTPSIIPLAFNARGYA
jgi:hypothetical protein